jgi:hypothetical protein
MSLFSNLRAARTLDDLCEALDKPPVADLSELAALSPERRPAGVVRQVVRELRAGGMSPVDVLALIGLILDLIAVIGPIVEEIVKRIRERHAATN